MSNLATSERPDVATPETRPAESGEPVVRKTVPFTPDEVERYHQEDRQTAGAIAGLMVGIFLLAAVLYVSIVVWSATNELTWAIGTGVAGVVILVLTLVLALMSRRS